MEAEYLKVRIDVRRLDGSLVRAHGFPIRASFDDPHEIDREVDDFLGKVISMPEPVDG